MRANNEDAYLADDDSATYAVADGMGGCAAGEVASKIAISRVRPGANGLVTFGGMREWLRLCFESAHKALLRDMRRRQGRTGMGTTLTAAVIIGDVLHVGHAGDSALFVMRGHQAKRFTRSQAVGHALDNCLGVSPEAFKGIQYVGPMRIEPGDRIVLATDGLTNYLDKCDPAVVLQRHADARELVRFALEMGGADNVTVVDVRVSEKEPSVQTSARPAQEAP